MMDAVTTPPQAMNEKVLDYAPGSTERFELESRLKLISTNDKIWRLSSVGITGDGEPHVEIKFSNPDLLDMPNDVSFRFPVVDVGPWGNPEPLVCLHASLACPASRGLYFEGPDLMYDGLEDFHRFWTPLRRVL